MKNILCVGGIAAGESVELQAGTTHHIAQKCEVLEGDASICVHTVYEHVSVFGHSILVPIGWSMDKAIQQLILQAYKVTS